MASTGRSTARLGRRGSFAAALVAVVTAACSDAGVTAPADPSQPLDARRAEAPDQLASVRWNALARQLVATVRTDPPMAARYYALLSVAQQRAVTAAQHADRGEAEAQRHLRVRAAVVAASAEVLAYAYPGQLSQIADAERGDLALIQEVAPRTVDLTAARQLGVVAAKGIILAAATDGADAVWAPSIPTGPGLWFPASSTAMPLRPLWGSVRPWLMQRGSQFRPAPPPAFDSPAFAAALGEVRRISDTRTDEQLRIALRWADGAGTATPPGHWNAIAADLIERHGLNEERAVDAFAYLNMALMDASIACWDAKYSYWLIRPSQADPAITTPVGLPNFPSYVSGHATFSGAAATVLGDIFPGERRGLEAAAEEAAMSRLYGGIHYRFDNDQGLALGRKIGALAVELRRRGS